MAFRISDGNSEKWIELGDHPRKGPYIKVHWPTPPPPTQPKKGEPINWTGEPPPFGIYVTEPGTEEPPGGGKLGWGCRFASGRSVVRVVILESCTIEIHVEFEIDGKPVKLMVALDKPPGVKDDDWRKQKAELEKLLMKCIRPPAKPAKRVVFHARLTAPGEVHAEMFIDDAPASPPLQFGDAVEGSADARTIQVVPLPHERG